MNPKLTNNTNISREESMECNTKIIPLIFEISNSKTVRKAGACEEYSKCGFDDNNARICIDLKHSQ
jgi:hypothetical protein